MINILIGVFLGTLTTLLIIGYTFGIVEEQKIKSESMYSEILEELKTYKKHYEATDNMNKDYWG